ncbi:hypothetical protein ACWGPT_09450 [Pseudorhizobium sp. NPDC055634]
MDQQEYDMQFRTQDLGFHPSVTEWVAARFGETCSGTMVLMLLAVCRLAGRLEQDWRAPYLELVENIVKISAVTKQVQQVPSFKTFLDLFDEYWSEDHIRELHYRGDEPVSDLAIGRILSSFTPHDEASASVGTGVTGAE